MICVMLSMPTKCKRAHSLSLFSFCHFCCSFALFGAHTPAFILTHLTLSDMKIYAFHPAFSINVKEKKSECKEIKLTQTNERSIEIKCLETKHYMNC